MSLNLPQGMQINAPLQPGYETILTPEALEFVAKLHRAFEPRRQELLKARVERQARIDAGEMPDFLPETAHIRNGDWKVAPVPAALQCRRVEITGPVEAKMIINAFNSGADSYMSDFEDSNSPKWENQIQGQLNIYQAIRRELSFTNEVTKVYAYWQNYRLPADFITLTDEGISVKLPREASELERSYIRVWGVNQYGVSYDILVPLDRGEVLENTANITRHDKYANIIYFMLVDRFKNGNPKNDHPMNRPDVNPKADYQGGDLAGLQQEIMDGYFTKLGVNTLWVSPLNQNPMEPYGYSEVGKTKFAGYHGYWPISSSKVDFRFGTNDELKALVAEAHSHGINVLLDYVANHVHQDHPLYKNHPEYATPLYLPDGRMNTQLWDEQRLTTWFDTFMPSLDFGNPKVVSMKIGRASCRERVSSPV